MAQVDGRLQGRVLTARSALSGKETRKPAYREAIQTEVRQKENGANRMTTANWISIVSASIVALGWFVTGYLNRRKDVAQKRLEHRLEALKSFLPVWFSIQKSKTPFNQPGFLQMLETARGNFQLYGYEDEISAMEEFISACENQNLQQANSSLSRLMPLVRDRIRNELEIDT
jgi:hypothetical protein